MQRALKNNLIMLKWKLLIFFIGILVTMPGKAIEKLNVQIFGLPNAIEPAAITTAGHYILAGHVLRSLTKVDKFGQVEGDLASAWKISENSKT